MRAAPSPPALNPAPASHDGPPRAVEDNPVALRLGYLALLPFVAGAVLAWLVRASVQPHVTAALSGYAATVIAFLGGVHWGFGFAAARPAARLFGWGVTPALVAWVAVVMPPSAGLVLHGLAIVACYVVDRKVYPRHGAARWLVLRFRLSVVAAACCFVAAAAAGSGGLA